MIIELVAGIWFLTYAVSKIVEHRRERLKPVPPPLPICGCTHSLALHDRQTDECHAEVVRKAHKVGQSPDLQEWVRCQCRRYIGPVPLDEVWAPPVIPTPADGTAEPKPKVDT